MTSHSREEPTFARINFTNVGFSKIFQNSEDENESLLANVAKNVDVLNSEEETVKSTPALLGLHYVGYKIQKERLNEQTGQWERISNFKLIGSKAKQFIDTRVAYDKHYRYRIKSVVKFTFKKKKSSFSLIESLNEILDFTKGESSVEQLRTNKFNSFLENDNLAIGDLTSAQLEDIKNDILKNNIELKSDNKFDVVSVYYDSDWSKNWIYVDTIKETPPKEPFLNVWPKSKKQQVLLNWAPPADREELVTSYNVYKRNNVSQRWTKIADQIQETFYVDDDVELNQKYIYAVSSYDLHDIESFLSDQIQAELNEDFDRDKKEKDLVFISGKGLTTSDINKVKTRSGQIDEKLIAKKNIVISPAKNMKETSKDIIIKVKSLDLNEEKEFKIELRNQKIN